MNNNLRASLVCTAFIMAGCADNKPSPPTEKMVQSATVKADNQSQLLIQGWYDLETSTTRPSDTQLRYITPGDTTKTAALKTFQFIAMTLAGGGQVQSFSKDQLKGHEVSGLINPSLDWLTPRVSAIFKAEMEKLPVKNYEAPIVIKPLVWKLTYKNLAGGDDNYQFAMLTTLSRLGKDKEGKERYKAIECSAQKVDVREYTLPEWQANNYEKVTKISQEIMDNCLKKLADEANSFLF
ncbi:hypothetical protein [Erwinia sp. CGal63]|uniref:hypothetical protein n=1 Tax=Erwinia sp. CGal63 TaxID=2919889 RepID=UPI00300A5BCD